MTRGRLGMVGMAFEAHIREISHEGGMLAPFTGDAPKLGQVMQLPGGKWIGKVHRHWRSFSRSGPHHTLSRR